MKKALIITGIVIGSTLLAILVYTAIWIFTAFSINGVVVDQYSNKPVGGVKVKVRSDEVKTDKNGKFRIAWMHKGDKITVEKEEYESRSQVVNRNMAKTQKIAIKMRPTTLTGVVTDAMSKEPLKDVTIEWKKGKTKSDEKGVYRISNLPESFKLKIEASDIYEVCEIEVEGTSQKNIEVCPVPAETSRRVHSFILYKQLDDAYNSLHPDMQSLVSRENYVKGVNEAFKESEDLGASLDGYETGDVKMLETWICDVNNKEYAGVAEIQETISMSAFGMKNTVHYLAHFIIEEGFWRWFMTPIKVVVINN